MRVSATSPSDGRVLIAGQHVADVELGSSQFHELAVGAGQFPGVEDVVIQWSQPVTVLHYWSFGRVL
jgi:hypothetical protein